MEENVLDNWLLLLYKYYIKLNIKLMTVEIVG